MTRYIASLRAAALVLLSMIILPSMAENVTPLLAKDLIGLAGKQGMMLTVEYEPVSRLLNIGTTRTFLSMSKKDR